MSLINSVSQQILTKHLLYASTVLGARSTAMNKAKVLVLMDLKFHWGERNKIYTTHM